MYDFCAAISTGVSAVQALFDSDLEVEPATVAVWNVLGSNKNTRIQFEGSFIQNCAIAAESKMLATFHLSIFR